jgi:hypothetical protein
MLLLQASFFSFFSLPILLCSHPGNRPQEELAKFGYSSDRKVEKKRVRILLYFCDLLEPTIFPFGQNICTVMKIKIIQIEDFFSNFAKIH